ncbi:hypothetical protein FRB95_011949 [Tulasnella sp. JGI-2019a]|nr:hypothetical protein FRB95_011949 [Tulasnella sp. JGI-2019a]
MLFAFGHTPGSLYIAHGRNAYWQGLPPDLGTYLKKEHRWLSSLSVSRSGASFHKEMPKYRSTRSGSRAQLLDVGRYKRVEEIHDSGEVINWVAFGPEDTYVVNTSKRTYSSNTSMLRNKKGKNTPIPLRCASFGYNGSWAVVEDDGEVRSSGLPGNIKAALESGPVRRIALSLHSITRYFIEYTDGETKFSLPESWHEHITKVERTSIQLDTLWTSSGTPTQPNIIFAFGSSKDQFAMITKHGIASNGIDKELHLDAGKYMAALSLGEGGAECRKVGTSPELLVAPDLRLKLEMELFEKELERLGEEVEGLGEEVEGLEKKMELSEGESERLKVERGCG